MTDKQDTVLGTGSAMLTPSGYQVRPKVALSTCNQIVPPAASAIIGKCPYYYQPLHGEYLETVEKVSVSSAWETVKAFATSWDPWKDKEVARRLLHRREQLIAPESTDSDWSRHGNFMMRHIGCGHKPPSYYVSYGYYYCSNYGAKLYPKLSPRGKAWLKSARWFLQANMEDGLKQNMKGNQIQMNSRKPGNGSFQMTVPRYELELNDDTFKTFAFKTHPLAYLDAGLADLPDWNWDLVRIMGQPNIQEWGDARTWEQAVDCGMVVLPKMINNSDIDDPVGKALGRLLAK
ncbi:hypothetical protein [Paraburkholderia dinghuensis]|uniref:Uncharacterized protein n=1 Tax=Paraburkholderia dinghuensis TaxID=2305225 RepID=A0A3N6MWW5_9BURK|nr:hypothetical protein [Paraburkholderia dinghuensis]RQH08478.1 hypothetical protein D1Y85_05585 [Paraburkholderia dinghuensis]